MLMTILLVMKNSFGYVFGWLMLYSQDSSSFSGFLFIICVNIVECNISFYSCCFHLFSWSLFLPSLLLVKSLYVQDTSLRQSLIHALASDPDVSVSFDCLSLLSVSLSLSLDPFLDFLRLLLFLWSSSLFDQSYIFSFGLLSASSSFRFLRNDFSFCCIFLFSLLEIFFLLFFPDFEGRGSGCVTKNKDTHEEQEEVKTLKSN